MGNEHLTVNIILTDYTVESDIGSWGLARTIIGEYDLNSDLQLELVGENNNVYVNLLRQRLEQENGGVDHFSQGEVIKIPNSKWQTLVIVGLIAPKPTGSITAQGEPEETSDTRVRTHSANSKKVIIIDPGHGGRDPGAIHPRHATREAVELRESDIALQYCIELKKSLENDYTIFMTRESDVYIHVNNRASFANSKNADLFISLHVNSAEKASESTHGIEVLYYDTDRDTQKSPKFINLLKKEFLDRKMDIRQYFMKDQDICVVRDTNMPAVLIEMGFMINQNDRTKLGNSLFMSDMMNSIKNAVDSFFSS